MIRPVRHGVRGYFHAAFGAHGGKLRLWGEKNKGKPETLLFSG